MQHNIRQAGLQPELHFQFVFHFSAVSGLGGSRSFLARLLHCPLPTPRLRGPQGPGPGAAVVVLLPNRMNFTYLPLPSIFVSGNGSCNLLAKPPSPFTDLLFLLGLEYFFCHTLCKECCELVGSCEFPSKCFVFSFLVFSRYSFIPAIPALQHCVDKFLINTRGGGHSGSCSAFFAGEWWRLLFYWGSRKRIGSSLSHIPQQQAGFVALVVIHKTQALLELFRSSLPPACRAFLVSG